VAASAGWIARAQTYESHSHLLCSKWSVSRATPDLGSARGEAPSAERAVLGAQDAARGAGHCGLRTRDSVASAHGRAVEAGLSVGRSQRPAVAAPSADRESARAALGASRRSP
jgi:hypothetical protein